MVLSTYIEHRCIFSSSIGSRVVAPFKWIMIKQKREQEPDRVVVRIDRKPRPNWETDGGSFAFDQLGLFFLPATTRRETRVVRRGQCDQIGRNFATLAKFYKSGNFLTVHFWFGKMLNQLCQICYITGLIFIVANGQMLKINPTIWSHCSAANKAGGQFIELSR